MSFVPDEGFLMQSQTQSWYLYLLLFLLAAYAMTRIVLGSLSSITFMATIRYHNAASMYNDNSQLQRQRDLVLNVFYIISMGFFAMFIMTEYGLKPYNLEGYKLLIFISGIILGFILFKSIILNILGLVFRKRNLFQEYLYHNYSYNKLMGIVFMPLNFILVYTTGTLQVFVIYLCFCVLAILLVSKIIRGAIFSAKKKIFNFYLFLYLCALELVPLLVLYKWFTTIV
jgi:hypothetical protein